MSAEVTSLATGTPSVCGAFNQTNRVLICQRRAGHTGEHVDPGDPGDVPACWTTAPPAGPAKVQAFAGCGAYVRMGGNGAVIVCGRRARAGEVVVCAACLSHLPVPP